MQWPRIAFAVMLILALVPAVSVMPSNALSQSDVTTTTQVTTDGTNTHTVATQYGTFTETSYVYGPHTFALYAFCTSKLQVKFNATEGQQFHIQWTTTTQVEVDLYIATPSFYVGVGGVCNLGGEPLYSKTGATGAVDWVAPSTGQYVAWLVNGNSSGSGSGILSIETSTITTVLSISSVTTPTKFVSSTTATSQFTLTTSQASIQITTSPPTGVGQIAGFQVTFGNLGFLGVGLAAVIASVLVLVRRRKPSVAAVLKQERPTAVQEPSRDIVSSQPIVQAKTVQSQPIVSTGYMDLDNALHGGIPEKFSVVIVSPSFDERDLLLRKVIESALSSGRLAILVSNDIGRTEDLTSRYPKGFYAFSPQADKISSHAPNLFKVPNIENLSDANLSLSLAIKDVVAKESATKPIIILDILSDVLLRHKSITTRRWLSDFVGKRKAEGFTILATLNPLTTTKEETQTIIDFFDGVIEIYEKPLMERSRRFLIIKKMYGRRYSENEVLMDKDKLF